MAKAPTAILTDNHPLLFTAACHIHGPADSFIVERCTVYSLDYHEEKFMPKCPNLEGADGQEMGNLRMNMGFWIKHSMRKA